MTDQAPSMSSVRLGLAVAWPAFWTGIPIKIVLFLLLLAAGLHPWEMPGLAFLLLLSIPVDLWAVGLSARTVFLERLRLQPPESLGLTLWWQMMLLNAVYLPLAYVIESQGVSAAKAVAGRIMETELLKGVPVAERISLELNLWGVPATILLLLLVLGWLFLFGWIVRRQAAAARPAEAPYPALVRQWDLLRVPADQPLVLTVVAVTGVILVLLFWSFMPVTTPHPHELYKKEPAKIEPPLKPVEALQKTEKIIAQAEAAVQALEKDKGKPKGKAKGKAQGKEPATSQAQPAGSGKAEAASGKAATHAADDHKP
jgi:hypothetical protein